MSTLQEYDLEVKPVKIFHRQGFNKLAFKAQDKKDEPKEDRLNIGKEVWKEPCLENEARMYEQYVIFVSITTNTWYYDLKYYLSQGYYLEYCIARKYEH